MWYVGLDVHNLTTSVSIRNSRGVVTKRLVVETTSNQLRHALAQIRGRTRIVCEAGPLARWIRDQLETRLRQVEVCDRRRTRLDARGSKTDRIDADKLSELLWKNELRFVHVARGGHVVLRQHMSHYMRMVCDRTRILLRLRALFLESGIRYKSSRSAPERVPLQRLRNPTSKYIARVYLEQFQLAKRLVQQARTAFLDCAREHPVFQLLQTIPYVGEIRAAQLLAIIVHPDRFSRRRFWSYGGLGLIQRTSSEHRISNGRVVRDDKARGLRLAKTGQPLLKKVLRDVALYASLGRGALRNVYDAHIKRGLQPSTARLALARKVAVVILAVWRSEIPFDPSLLSVQK